MIRWQASRAAPWFFLLFISSILPFGCSEKGKDQSNSTEPVEYKDVGFVQEYHEAWILDDNQESNDIRNIEIDKTGTVWIATASGIYKKQEDASAWTLVEDQQLSGAAYDVLSDRENRIWLATWNGLYIVQNDDIRRISGIRPPVSVLCESDAGIYALGHNGTWFCKDNDVIEKNHKIARSVRDARIDDLERLWVATDVGLFICDGQNTEWKKSNNDFISAYLSSLDVDNAGNTWVGGLGGVTIRNQQGKLREIKPSDGIPSVHVNCVRRDDDGTMWVGTNVGVVRFYSDGSHSLRFSRRWLVHDEVRDIAFDRSGNAWIATAGGVSVIRKKTMTLAEKEAYFYDQLMRRHIRAPWIAGQCRLEIPGDTSSWVPEDDDNDGEYTGGYLAMESLRYAVTKNPDALEKARKAFNFLRFLKEVTNQKGFFARTIVPASWDRMHDVNRTYTEMEKAEELVKDPRNKPVEKRWRKSADGQWWWKGDTSSDEMDGHMMGYYYFYEFAADEQDKKEISDHVCDIVDYLMEHNYNLIDIDGAHTRWGVWSPDKLNRDADWGPERNLNSFELLAFLKFAYHISGKEKYQAQYLELINKEGYLENTAGIHEQNPAWFIFFDVTLAAYVYPILLSYEEDPEYLKFYQDHMDYWMELNKNYESPLFNFIYNLARDSHVGLDASVKFLVDTPLDLVDWRIDHRKREDVRIVREPVLEDEQVYRLVPADIRAVVRWDKNPYAAVSGDPSREREPVFWLWPYWLGRYLGHIQ